MKTFNRKLINFQTVENKIKEKITELQTDAADLIELLNNQSKEDTETLLVIGCIAKQLNRPKIAELALQKCALNHSNITDDSWKAAYEELSFWITQSNQAQTIKIQNHIKTDRLKITLVVACMDRIDELLLTLPTWFNIPQITEYIIVDYASKIPLSEHETIMQWKNEHNITLLRVDDERYFNLGKAYNLAIDFATNHKILKIDCDYLNVSPEWIYELDSSKYDSHECYFIRGDWRFSRSLTGLLFCDKRDFVYFREDLNGWGFDDLDLARRIVENKQRIKEVIWPNISSYVKHLDHDDKQRTKNYFATDKSQTNYNNRLICHQPFAEVDRTPYQTRWTNSKIHITFKPKQSIRNIYCVTLKDKENRWNEFQEKLPQACKFEAIDTRNNPKICEQYGLYVRPSTVTYELYFAGGHGAVGCYLSHYLIWQEIVKKQLDYTLITEDDADTSSIISLLNNLPININSYEFIQMNKRFSYIRPENRLMFHGTESYVVSYEGAKKLIKATQEPWHLEYVYHNEIPNVKAMCNKRRIKQKTRIYDSNSIIAPADKFISMCCDPKCNEEVKLKHTNYPCIDINPNHSFSDIDSGMGHIWTMSYEQVNALFTKHEQHLNVEYY